MKLCARECLLNSESCRKTDCRQWMEYEDDLNCKRSRKAIEDILRSRQADRNRGH